MNKRAFKLLLLDFERLDGEAMKYVHSRVNKYILSCWTEEGSGAIVFCLESTPRTHPIVAKIRRWIDEVVNDVHLEQKVSYLCKICCVCGTSGASLMSCARCRSIYYCSKDCQTADWPAHKPACKKSINKTSVTYNMLE